MPGRTRSPGDAEPTPTSESWRVSRRRHPSRRSVSLGLRENLLNSTHLSPLLACGDARDLRQHRYLELALQRSHVMDGSIQILAAEHEDARPAAHPSEAREQQHARHVRRARLRRAGTRDTAPRTARRHGDAPDPRPAPRTDGARTGSLYCCFSSSYSRFTELSCCSTIGAVSTRPWYLAISPSARARARSCSRMRSREVSRSASS